jgi:biotin transporter BioY
MSRFLTELPALLGVLIIGMLLGSWLGASSNIWWLIVALAGIAIAAGIAGAVRRARRTTPSTP